MISALSFFALSVGLIVGSFLNVVILRYNTGRTIGGRSACFSCSKKLRWWELLPVLSFVSQNGKCRGCSSQISWQYPAVELVTAILFWMTALLWYPNFYLMVFWWLIWSLLIVIAVYDFHHKIIPQAFSHTFILLALLAEPLARLVADDRSSSFILHLLAGVALSAFFALLWGFSRGRWMGWGDVKLAFGIGALLGLSAGINAVFLAFYSGALVGLALIALSRKKVRTSGITMKTELPFAPFLIFGIIIVVLTGLNLLPF